MKVTCYINLQYKKKLEWNQIEPSVIFITKIELFGLNERVIEEARWKVKKKLITRFACIGTVPFARKVHVTLFIVMKTVIFIYRGRHEGITNVETHRDRQGQIGTYRDRQGQARTSMDRQGDVGTSRDRKGMSLFVSVCPCLVPAWVCLSLGCPWHWLA